MSHSSTAHSGSTWRMEGAPTAPAPATSVMRVVVTLVLVALVVAMGVLLYLWIAAQHPRTVLVTALFQPHAGNLPRVLYAEHDRAELGRLFPDAKDWTPKLEQADTLTSLPDELRDLKVDGDDTLVLYFTGHGLSLDGKPYLAGSSFFSERRPQVDWDKTPGLHPIGKLLAHAAGAGAGRTVLVLDCNRLVFDPRVGMVRSEFVESVIAEVAKMKGGPFYVLLASGTPSPTTLVPARQRSRFSEWLCAGLIGEADKKPCSDSPDGSVSLAELYKYVWNCADRENDAASEEFRPYPLLLQAGLGVVAYKTVEKEKVPLRLISTPLVELPPIQVDAETILRQVSAPPRSDWRDPSGMMGHFGGALAWQTPAPTPAPAPAPAPAADADKGKADPKAEPMPPMPAPAPAPTATPMPAPMPMAPTTPMPAPMPMATPPAAAPAPGDKAKPPEGPSPAAIALATARAKTARAMLDLWAVRDQLARRPAAGEGAIWLPLDFAPSGWQSFQAELLERECEFRNATTADSLNRLARELAATTDDLKTLAAALTAKEAAPLPPGRTDRAGFIRAWNRFLPSKERASFHEGPSQPDEIRWAQRTLQTWDQSLAIVPWMLHWQAESVARGSVRSRDDKAARDLVAAVVTFQETLRAESAASREGGFKGSAAGMVRFFKEHDERLLQPALDGVRQAVAERVKEVLSSDERALDLLLGSPLTTAVERESIYRKLGWLTPQPPAAATLPAAPTEFRTPARIDPAVAWNPLVGKVLTLEAKVWGLIDDRFPDAMQAQLGRRPLPEWKNIARLLRDKTLQAPDLAQNGPAAVNQTAARLVDPRDWRKLSEPTERLPLLEVDPAPAPPELVVKANPPRLVLSTEKQKVTFSFTSINLISRRVTAKIRGQGLRITRGTAVVTGPITLDLDGSGSGELAIEVAPAGMLDEDPRSPLLALEATFELAPATPVTVTIPCELPKVDRIDLVIHRENARGQEDVDSWKSGGRLRMQPFPNRATAFQFALVNHAGEARQLTAELYAIPDDEPGLRLIAPGQILDSNFQLLQAVRDAACRSYEPGKSIVLRPNATKIGEATIALNAESNKPQWFAWKAPAPAAPPAAPPPAAPPPPPPPPKEKVPATRGMVCVLREPARPERVWVHWLEIVPFAPRDFLTARAEYAEQTIRVTISPKAEFEKELRQAILLKLENAQGGKPLAELAPGDSRGVLESLAPSDSQRREVSIAVDNYPRAFRFRVTCEPNGDAQNLEGLPRVKLRGFKPVPPKSDMPPPPPKETPFVVGTRVYPFRDEVTALDLRIEVDAPATSFPPVRAEALKDDDRNRVELTVGESEPLRFYGPRKVETQAEVRKDDGFLMLSSNLSDHAPSISFGYRNRLVPLTLQLAGKGFRTSDDVNRETSDSVQLLLDNFPPTVAFDLRQLPPTTRGASLDVWLKAFDGDPQLDVDQADLDRVELGIDAQLTGKPMYNIQAERIGERWRARLTAKQLEGVEGSQLALFARAVDKVGNLSREAEIRGELKAAPAPGTDLAKPGVIEGTLMFGDTVYTNGFAKVWLEKAGGEKTSFEKAGGGAFRFENVPPGKYVLQAEGTPNGNRASAKIDVEPVPPNGPKRSLKLQLR